VFNFCTSYFRLPGSPKSELAREIAGVGLSSLDDVPVTCCLFQERLLELVVEERERSQKAVRELIAEERLHLQVKVIAFNFLDLRAKLQLKSSCQ